MSEIYKNKQLVNAKSRAKEHSDKTCAESSTENATNIQQFIWAIGPNHLGCTQSTLTILVARIASWDT